MTYENDAWDLEEEKELGDEIGATGDEDGNEDEKEALRKIIDAVENHDGNINLLYSGTGMYLLGMTFGWTALRVVHTRKAVLNYKKILGITTHSLAFPHGGPFPQDSYKAAA
jgi:hypothetical protein